MRTSDDGHEPWTHRHLREAAVVSPSSSSLCRRARGREQAPAANPRAGRAARPADAQPERGLRSWPPPPLPAAQAPAPRRPATPASGVPLDPRAGGFCPAGQGVRAGLVARFGARCRFGSGSITSRSSSTRTAWRCHDTYTATSSATEHAVNSATTSARARRLLFLGIRVRQAAGLQHPGIHVDGHAGPRRQPATRGTQFHKGVRAARAGTSRSPARGR